MPPTEVEAEAEAYAWTPIPKELAKRREAFANRHKSACQWTQEKKKGSADLVRPGNSKFVAGLQEYVEVVDLKDEKGDEFRKREAQKKITQVRRCAFSIETAPYSKLEATFGESFAKKLQQIRTFGATDRVRYATSRQRRELAKVWGIGSSTAKALCDEGITSVDKLRAEVRRNPSRVSRQVRKALNRHEDLLERMPRDEAAVIAETAIRGVVEARARQKKVTSRDPRGDDVLAVAAGSFRRGKATCGDVDVLVTCKRWKADPSTKKERRRLLYDVVRLLDDSEFLTDHLTCCDDEGRPRKRYRRGEDHDDDDDPDGPASYMGICKIAEKHRRIDVKIYDYFEWPFALLYFTGNDYFNRSMRLYAKKIGYSLSDRGLRRRLPDGRKDDAAECVNRDCPDERAIFRKLGLDYKHPYERDPHADAKDVDRNKKRLREELDQRRHNNNNLAPLLPEHLPGLGFNH